MNKINYKWNLKDGYPAKNGLSVLSTFACGGGSTMGYKLAGFEVIGANDIDPQMAEVYKINHNPKHYFLMPIGDLVKKAENKELPDEFYNLDILDGSPPCSTFSSTGLREKAWKKEKQFREGQAKQKLSDLFFDYIDLVGALKPKVFVAENVKGMLAGNATAYTRTIMDELTALGYNVQLFLLNGATMGLPQKRERVFFIGSRKDLNMPKLKLSFNEKPILFAEVSDNTDREQKITETYSKYWDEAKPGGPVGKFQTTKKMHLGRVANTIPAGGQTFHPVYKRGLNDKELALIGSYPLDYNYNGVGARYLIGMSVPPLMAAKIAEQIKKQLFMIN
jgi:DNA (cytosine-5)-methyltransferase 1